MSPMSQKIDPKDLDLTATIAHLNKGPRTEALWERLIELTDGRAVLVLSGDQIDGEQTAEALRFSRKFRATIPDGKSAAALRAELEHEEVEADPVTGAPLWKGRTPDGRADWSAVPKADREVVAYAVETGQWSGPSEQAAYQIAKTPEAPPWPRLRAEWGKILADTRPDAAVTVARIRARLIARPAPEVPPQRPFVAEASPAKPAPGGVAVFVACAERDVAYAQALRTHLRSLERTGLIALSFSTECPAGANRECWLEARINGARVLLAIWSADMPESLAAQLLWGEAMGARVIPIRARPCVLPDWLARLTALPDRPVSGPGDDAAWVAVAEGVRRVVRSLQ